VARKKAPARRTPSKRPGRSGNPSVRGASRPGDGGRAGRSSGGPKRPLPKGDSFFTPAASPLRQEIERVSAPLLVLFHRLPRPVFAALPLLLLVLGAFLPVPLALVCLALALLLLGWLAFLSWPRASGGQKLMRLVVPGLVVAIAILRVARG
jgi:hypothetical protein